MFSGLRRIRKIFRMGTSKFDILSSIVFSGRIILKQLRIKKTLGASRFMLPRKMFEILHTVVANLALFEQFLGKFCLNFLPLNLSNSPNMMHFDRTFSIMRA